MRAENNFKQQTEIGLIPEDWEVVRLGDVETGEKEKYSQIDEFLVELEQVGEERREIGRELNAVLWDMGFRL